MSFSCIYSLFCRGTYLLTFSWTLFQWGNIDFGQFKNSGRISMCSKGEKTIIPSICCWGRPKVVQDANVSSWNKWPVCNKFQILFPSVYDLSLCGWLVESRYQGHSLAKELVTRGLQTTVITDSAVFAMISRVNMVSIIKTSLFWGWFSVYFLTLLILSKGYCWSSCCHG